MEAALSHDGGGGLARAGLAGLLRARALSALVGRRVPQTRVVVGGMNTEELAPPDDSQIAFDARSWRFRCRVMAAISLFTYVPLITLVAVFESR